MEPRCVYNLTIDELQKMLGELEKPLAKMKLGELLRFVERANLTILGIGPTPQVALGPDFSEKTVAEVWWDIHQQSTIRQPLFTEITLKDLLVKAGVFPETAPSISGVHPPLVLDEEQDASRKRKQEHLKSLEDKDARKNESYKRQKEIERLLSEHTSK